MPGSSGSTLCAAAGILPFSTAARRATPVPLPALAGDCAGSRRELREDEREAARRSTYLSWSCELPLASPAACGAVTFVEDVAADWMEAVDPRGDWRLGGLGGTVGGASA